MVIVWLVNYCTGFFISFEDGRTVGLEGSSFQYPDVIHFVSDVVDPFGGAYMIENVVADCLTGL